MDVYDWVDKLQPKGYTRRKRLLLVYAVGLSSLILTYTVGYNLGMRYFEDDPRSLFHSAQIVVETMTTTGYGADSPWSTPVMNTMVITMQVTGVVIGFVTLRILVIPLFERTPLNLDDRRSARADHVVLAEYQRDTEVVRDELDELGSLYLLIESEGNEAKMLSDEGYQTIHGDPEDRADHPLASIDRATLDRRRPRPRRRGPHRCGHRPRRSRRGVRRQERPGQPGLRADGRWPLSRAVRPSVRTAGAAVACVRDAGGPGRNSCQPSFQHRSQPHTVEV